MIQRTVKRIPKTGRNKTAKTGNKTQIVAKLKTIQKASKLEVLSLVKAKKVKIRAVKMETAQIKAKTVLSLVRVKVNKVRMVKAVLVQVKIAKSSKNRLKSTLKI